MPFTGSHPAAILPLLGTGLPASALVIGSMSPDIPYYLPITTTSWPTHTALGIVGLDLLIGLIAWALWHGFISAPALDHAPDPVRERLVGRVEVGLRRRLRPQQVLLTVVALDVGAATHVLWDEFTHPGRWGTRHLSVLNDQWGGLQGYRWAQYGSGVFGALAIAWWLLQWWQRTQPRPVAVHQHAARTWWGLLVVGAIVGVLAAVRSPSLQKAAFRGATSGGGAILAAGCLLALGWHLMTRFGPAREAAPDLTGKG